MAAGRALGISASAVSKSISRLEARLGVRLFQRSTRSVRLTTEGSVFLERCQRILVELEAAEHEMSSMTQLPRGRLRVGLPYAAGLALPVLAGFMEQYPEIELDLDFSGEPSDSRLVSRRLGAFRILLVASPSYLKRRGRPAKPEDLAGHDCLHYRYPSSGKLQPWPLLVNAQRGIACVPDFAVKDALSSGDLRVVLDGHMTRSNTFRILWPTSKQMSPKVRAFVDYVIAHFAGGLAWSVPSLCIDRGSPSRGRKAWISAGTEVM